MILLADRKKAQLFLLRDGAVISEKKEVLSEYVPQKVKHGDDTWDAQDKIFRHIQNHLHRHLLQVAHQAEDFAKKDHIAGIIIGGHKMLFMQIKKHLSYPWANSIKGYFVTDLKAPFNDIVAKAKKEVARIEGASAHGVFTHV